MSSSSSRDKSQRGTSVPREPRNFLRVARLAKAPTASYPCTSSGNPFAEIEMRIDEQRTDLAIVRGQRLPARATVPADGSSFATGGCKLDGGVS